MTAEHGDSEALRESLSLMSEARSTTLGLVADLAQTQAEYAPARWEWSVAEILDHLLKSDEIYRGQVRGLIDLADDGEEPVRTIGFRELDTGPALLPKASLPFVDVPFRMMNRMVPDQVREIFTKNAVIPFRAPEAALPAPEGDIGKQKRKLRASLKKTKTMLTDQDVSGMVLDHPMLGRNSVPQLLRIQARHEERHHQQIESLLGRKGFPQVEDPKAGAPDGQDAEPTTTIPRASAAAAKVPLKAFARDAKKALADGRELANWWKEKALVDELELFPLKRSFAPYYEVQGFFDEILFMGDIEPTTIMGCLQRHRFKRRRAPNQKAEAHLETFIDDQFLTRCLWTHPDDLPGGFRYLPICYQDKDGHLGRFAADDTCGLSLSTYRDRYEWVVLQVDILDFVRSNPLLEPFNGTLSRFIKESAYIAIHDDLGLETTKAPRGTIAERRFGYTFLPREVGPNFFGFGPGNFGAAIKQWRFLLFQNGDVEAQIAFIVSPRSERVLDIAGFDPVYTSIDLADLMALGQLGLRGTAQDVLDATFLGHHGAVHANLVLGLREIWEGQRWTPSFGSW